MFLHKSHKSIFPLFHPYSCTRGLKGAGEEGPLPALPSPQSSCWGLISFLALTSLLIFLHPPPHHSIPGLSLSPSHPSLPHQSPKCVQFPPRQPPPSLPLLPSPLWRGGRGDSPNVKLLAKRPCKIDLLHSSSPWHYFRGLLNRKPESLKME